MKPITAAMFLLPLLFCLSVFAAETKAAPKAAPKAASKAAPKAAPTTSPTATPGAIPEATPDLKSIHQQLTELKEQLTVGEAATARRLIDIQQQASAAEKKAKDEGSGQSVREWLMFIVTVLSLGLAALLGYANIRARRVGLRAAV